MCFWWIACARPNCIHREPVCLCSFFCVSHRKHSTVCIFMAVVKAAVWHSDEIRTFLYFGHEDNIITVVENYIPEFAEHTMPQVLCASHRDHMGRMPQLFTLCDAKRINITEKCQHIRREFMVPMPGINLGCCEVHAFVHDQRKCSSSGHCLSIWQKLWSEKCWPT